MAVSSTKTCPSRTAAPANPAPTSIVQSTFGQASSQVPDRREQRKLDQAAGLVTPLSHRRLSVAMELTSRPAGFETAYLEDGRPT